LKIRRAGLFWAMPPGFIAPCLPTKAQQPPSGDAWLHEIKHDGFRVIARKDGPRVRLYSRPGNDLTYRFPLIVEALARLRASSCTIDGEACAATTRSVDHLFRGGASNLVVWACGYGAILRYCRVRWAATRHLTVTGHPRAGHLIRVHGLASLEVTRATHPGSLLITERPIPRKSAVRVSERQ
jgi:bifunctional non-homologous end joining protein LigD